MANSDTTIIVTVVSIMLIAVLIFAPPLIASGIQGLRDLLSDFRNMFFEDWGTNGGLLNQSSIGWNVQFEDGSESTISPESSLGYSVLYNNKPVYLIYMETYVSLDYLSKPSSINAKMWFTIEIDNTKNLVDQGISNVAFTVPNEETWTKIPKSSVSVKAQSIEAYDAKQYTSHTLRGTSNLTLTLSWSDGTTEVLTGTASGELTVQVSKNAEMDVKINLGGYSIFPTMLH